MVTEKEDAHMVIEKEEAYVVIEDAYMVTEMEDAHVVTEDAYVVTEKGRCPCFFMRSSSVILLLPTLMLFVCSSSNR